MRPKVVRRVVEPPRRGARPPSQVLGVIALLIVGAIIGLTVERLVDATFVANNPEGITPSSSPTEAIDAPSDEPLASDEPTEAPGSPILEAQIPASVNDTDLATQSGTDATGLTNNPNGRALDAAVRNLGKQPTDLEIAVSYDAAGVLDLQILGFRIDGTDPATLRTLLLETWLAAGAPGVSSRDVVVSATPTTEVSYGDDGANEWLFVHADSVFIVETADDSLAADVIAAIEGTSPATSPGTSPATSPESSPAPS